MKSMYARGSRLFSTTQKIPLPYSPFLSSFFFYLTYNPLIPYITQLGCACISYLYYHIHINRIQESPLLHAGKDPIYLN